LPVSIAYGADVYIEIYCLLVLWDILPVSIVRYIAC